MILNPDLLPAFFVAALALNFTPGADMMFVTAQSLSGGRSAGIAASIGVGTSATLHSALAGLGLAAIVAAAPLAFEFIRYAGAAYLIWVAIQIIRSPSQLGASQGNSATGLFRAYRQGFITNLLNPKVIIFILAFLPQFTDPARGNIGLQIFLLGVLFSVTGTLVLIGISFAGGRFRNALTAHPYAGRAVAWISGTIIGGLAIALLVSARRAG